MIPSPTPHLSTAQAPRFPLSAKLYQNDDRFPTDPKLRTVEVSGAKKSTCIIAKTIIFQRYAEYSLIKFVVVILVMKNRDSIETRRKSLPFNDLPDARRKNFGKS